MENIICDRWLSSLISKPAYRIEKYEKDFNSKILLNDDSFIEAKINTNNIDEINDIQKNGFKIIECELNFMKRNSILQKEYNPKIKIRLSNNKDEEEVRKIASKAFVHSRFYKDPNFDKKVASKIKEEWAGNFFKGKRGDHLIVGEYNNSIVGFLLLLVRNGNLIIDLIAVKEINRGLGIAKSMILFAEKNFMDDLKLFSVGTQLSNLSAINLYNNMGFSLISSNYAFHLHTKKDL